MVGLPVAVHSVPAGALDLTGERFGALIALRPLNRTHLGIVWWCSCDCGGRAKRHASRLMRSRRRGEQPCCQVCLEELRRGYWQDRAAMKREVFLARLERGETLWTDREVAALEETIMSAIEERLPSRRPDAWPARRYEPDPGYFDPAGVRAANRRAIQDRNLATKHADPVLQAQLATMLGRELADRSATE